MRIPILVALAVMLASSSSIATTMVDVDRVCPIGGQTYKSFEIASTTSFGRRLDLRPTGPAAYLPWVECPNGFVVYKDEKEFTDAEIEALTPVVASDAYQKLRAEHVIAYRVVYMLRRLGKSEADVAWLLLKSAWEAEDGRRESLRQAYLAEALPALQALAARPEKDDEWWAAAIAVAEVERQRSRFDEAVVALDGLPMEGLPVGDIKARVVAQIRDRAVKKDPAPAEISE